MPGEALVQAAVLEFILGSLSVFALLKYRVGAETASQEG